MDTTAAAHSLHTLTLRARAAAPVRLRRLFDRIAAAPAPPVEGLLGRHWRLVDRSAVGRYLFDGEEPLRGFLAAGSTRDPAIAWLGASGELSEFETERIDSIPPDVQFDRPVFVVSGPRAGSTLLYDLLASGGGVWLVVGESHGMIEGIPGLHVASRGFESHRLTAADADPLTQIAVRAAFVADLQLPSGGRYLELDPGDRPPRVRLLEKTPENSLRVPFLDTIFPDARFLFLHRDARESISSMLEAWHHDGFVSIPQLPGWEGGEWHLLLPPGWRAVRGRPLADVAAFQWEAANRCALDDLAEIVPSRWTAVEYAELVADPEGVVRRLRRFLELPDRSGALTAAEVSERLSSTTISRPSRQKWRFNPEFREAAIAGLEPMRRRLAGLSLGPHEPRGRQPVRFACFVDQAAGLAGRRAAPGWRSHASGAELVVHPTLELQLGPTIPSTLLQRARFRERFQADCPLLWIEDPGTRALYPFWARREDAYLLRRLVPGMAPPIPRGHPLHTALAAAGILLEPACLDERREWAQVAVDAARGELDSLGVCALPSLLHPSFLGALCRYYRRLVAGGEWQVGDPQVELRYGWHNEPLSRYVHHQLTAFVSRVAGISVKPSYAYVSAYRGGAVLRRHVDREQCRFTMSVLIDRTCTRVAAEPWPIHFDTREGTVARTQRIGDALLFLGCELPHYRDRLADGQSETALLFHYVAQDFAGVLD